MKYTQQEIVDKVKAVPYWGHSIPLPFGIVTPGLVMKNDKTLIHLNMPADLSGKRILDVGTWDGFYAFEAERRGAEVVAIDNLERMKIPSERQFASKGNKGFETAKDILNSNVTFCNTSVYDVTPEWFGMFDITLLLGVLYHLKHPMLALEKIAAVTSDAIFIESAWFRSISRLPMWRYMGGGGFNGDPTNWFMFNTPAIVQMLKHAGFPKVDILYRTPLSPISIGKGLYFNKHSLRHFWNSSVWGCGRIIVRGTK